jgi:Uma2 family endonuclease
MLAQSLDLFDLELPITLRPAERMSDDALQRFSQANKPYRIERNKHGEIVIMTPVGGIGGTHEQYVSRVFSNWADQDGTGIDFSPNTGFNLRDGSCLSPDASWVSLERWDTLTAAEQAGYPPLCPEFIIGIRSRTDSRRLLEAKMQLWIDNGAQLAWLIDPVDASVSIYRPGQSTETLERPEVVVAGAPVAGFELRVARLWPAE